MGAEPGLHRIAALAARQHGLITRRQLAALGLSRRVIQRLVAQGWLHRIHRGVYAVGHPALSRRGRWLAATLALEGALSHRAAGELWAIVPAGQIVEVTLLGVSGRAHREGLLVHHGRLAAREVTAHDGIPVTTVVRTLLDLAAVLDARGLGRAFEEAQVHHRLRPAELAAEVAARDGHRGSGRMRALLAGAVDPGQVESVLELRFLALCGAHGLPRPLSQVRFGASRVDFWFPEARVVVETDGARFHASAGKRSRDAEKDAALAALGITVRRLRWADVTERPAAVASALRAAGVRSS